MNPPFFKTLLLIAILLASWGGAVPQKKNNQRKVIQKKTKIMAATPSPKPKMEGAPSPLFIQSSFGINRWEGWGPLSGIGLGVFPSVTGKFGWGLDGRIHLVSQGSLFTLLGGIWYFINSPLVSERFISLGFFLGAGFPGGDIPLKKTALVGLFEIGTNHRLSDYSWFKVWTRAGVIDKQVATQLGFSLLFQLK